MVRTLGAPYLRQWSEIEQFAEKAFAALFLMAATVIIVVVIPPTWAVLIAIALGRAWGLWLVYWGRCRARRGIWCACGAFDDFVQLSPIQPDATAFGAIVDFHAATVGHHKSFVVYRAAHLFLHHVFRFINGERDFAFKLGRRDFAGVWRADAACQSSAMAAWSSQAVAMASPQESMAFRCLQGNLLSSCTPGSFGVRPRADPIIEV